jgi:DoxX
MMTLHLISANAVPATARKQLAAQLNHNDGPHDSRAIDGGTPNQQIAFTGTFGGARNDGPLGGFHSAPCRQHVVEWQMIHAPWSRRLPVAAAADEWRNAMTPLQDGVALLGRLLLALLFLLSGFQKLTGFGATVASMGQEGLLFLLGPRSSQSSSNAWAELRLCSAIRRA